MTVFLMRLIGQFMAKEKSIIQYHCPLLIGPEDLAAV